MSLIDSLGAGYIREFFTGALLKRGDVLHMIRDATSIGDIITHSLNLTSPTSSWQNSSLPSTEFESFSDIAWPQLGYRNLESMDYGNMVVFASATRSVLRGLRQEHIQYNDIGIYSSCGLSYSFTNPAGDMVYTIKQVFNPTFYTYAEGMPRIKSGEWLAFALSEDLAVSVSGAGGYCDILFRNKVVGSLAENGSIELFNRVIKRSTITKLLS